MLGILLLMLCSAPAFVRSEDSSKHIPGLDVTKATFNATLAAMPGDAHVLMEFYATWCPACRLVSRSFPAAWVLSFTSSAVNA